MKQLITLLVATIMFTACNKQQPHMRPLTCPPYDPTFLNTWFPYEQGATYYYKDSAGNTHWLTIDNRIYYNGDEGMSCTPATQCIPGGVVFASRDLQKTDKINLNALHSLTPEGEHLDLMWNSGYIYLLVNPDGTLSLNPLYYNRPEAYYQDIKPELFTRHAKISLHEAEYNDVYEIVLKTHDMGNTRRLYLAKEHGIIGYTTTAGITYWKE